MLSTPTDNEQLDYRGITFIGRVVDNDDPTRKERVRVTIPGLYEGDVGDLPWCAPKVGKGFGNKAGVGVFSVPVLGSWVFVELQDGDAHYPFYTGSPVQDQTVLAEASVNYPNRYGFKDAAGNVVYVDPTAGSNTIKIQHASGTTVTINNDGSVNLTAVSTITSSAPQWNHTGPVEITGDVVINGDEQVNGDIDLTGTATADIDVVASALHIHLATHKHLGVTPGGGQSGIPVPTP